MQLNARCFSITFKNFRMVSKYISHCKKTRHLHPLLPFLSQTLGISPALEELRWTSPVPWLILVEWVAILVMRSINSNLPTITGDIMPPPKLSEVDQALASSVVIQVIGLVTVPRKKATLQSPVEVVVATASSVANQAIGHVIVLLLETQEVVMRVVMEEVVDMAGADGSEGCTAVFL